MRILPLLLLLALLHSGAAADSLDLSSLNWRWQAQADVAHGQSGDATGWEQADYDDEHEHDCSPDF